jgi:chemotaxis protein methyltransferase CheR
MKSTDIGLAEREAPPRSFVFTDADFQQIRRLIHAHAGIQLSDSKRDMVYSRLGRRLRATGQSSFHDYLALLEAGDRFEWEAFVNALTTNLTAFFREPHHFAILAEHIKAIKPQRPVTLWCCATSTGEEPYTMAMTMVDVFGSYTPPVRILATDLDTNVLEKARAGIYALDRVDKLPKEILKRFFLKGSGPNAGLVRVRRELRDMIVFRQLNLLDEQWPIRGPLDAIFCRNVMIYFDRDTQHRILRHLAPLLAMNGLLFAGHSESFADVSDLFHSLGRTVYRAAAAGAPAAR